MSLSSITRTVNTDSHVIDLKREYIDSSSSLKPCGLWYSLNNEWLEWVRENMSGWEHKNNFELSIDESGIYIIDDMTSLDRIHDEYGYNSSYGSRSVSWVAIKSKYKGFEMRNYSTIRAELFINGTCIDYLWVTAMDCSSGCIWDLSAIVSIKHIKHNISLISS